MRVLAILIVFVSLSGRAQTPDDNGIAGGSKQNLFKSSRTQVIEKAPIPKVSPVPEPQDKNAASELGDRRDPITIIVTPPKKHDFFDYLGLGISGLLASITGFGVFVAWRGLPEVLRQARAAETAAKAANKSAEAAEHSADSVARIERPWLLFEKLKIRQRAEPSASTGMIQTTGPSAFEYVIRNYGRTPAKVVALYSRIDLSDSIADPPHPEIYEMPDSTVYPYIIPQGDFRNDRAELEPESTDKDYLEILSGLLYVWAYAVIRYSDVHGNIYETRICYRNDSRVDDLRLDGPAVFNVTT